MSKDKLIQDVLDESNAAFEALRDYHIAFEDDYRFWAKREHYSGSNVNERDRTRIKPRTRALDTKITHKGFQVSRGVGRIWMRPVDKVEDPNTTEAARFLLEYKINDPRLHWRRILKRAIRLAMGAKAAAVALDIRYDLGPFPMIVPRLLDPRALAWTPGFQDPDDITCPEVFEEMWCSPAELARDESLRDTKGLKGETPEVPDSSRPNPLKPIMQTDAPQQQIPYSKSPKLVRVVKRWRRFDPTMKDVPNGVERNLLPSERYMACNCGYEDRSQDGTTLPESGGMCPQCAATGMEQPLARVDVEGLTDRVQSYARGRRLTIIAEDGGDRRVLYDDAWLRGSHIVPRSVPYLFLRCYDLPLEPWGQSDTERDWSYITAENAMNRRAYESISRAGGIIVTEGSGLTKNDGKTPYEFSDAPISLAKAMGIGGAQAVQFFQPRAMLSDLMPYMTYLTQQISAQSGIFDASATFGPQRSKDVAVGTMQTLERTGEIPSDDMSEDVNEALGIFYGVWFDLARAITSPEEWIGIRGLSGAVELMQMKGELIPNHDVIVEALPSWANYDNERMQAVAMLTAEPDPGLREIKAEAANIPPSIVRRIGEAQQMALMRAATANPNLNGGAPRNGAAPPSGVAGMVPAPVTQGVGR